MRSTHAVLTNALLDDKSLGRKLNIVLQKEYLIIPANHPRPILATESVRSCYAILLHHPKQSAIAHWDDNTCRLDIDKLMKEFLGNNLKITDLDVHLIGGWRKNEESKKCGDFLAEYFKKLGANLNLDGFQLKKTAEESNKLDEQGYDLVALDANTGKVYLSNDWSRNVLKLNDGKYRGAAVTTRYSDIKLINFTHLQEDTYPDSGSHLYSRDSYEVLREEFANKLCAAARDNNKKLLIESIDASICSVTASPVNAKGWTPLHYACKMGHFEMAYILMSNGADLFQKNDAGKTPHDLLDKNQPTLIRKVSACYNVIQTNIKSTPFSLTLLSQFSRHPEHVATEKSATISTILGMLDDEEGLASVENALRHPGI